MVVKKHDYTCNCNVGKATCAYSMSLLIIDMDSIRALATGLNDFQGAVLLVSHNQGFLSDVAHELWSINHGKVKVTVGIEKQELL